MRSLDSSLCVMMLMGSIAIPAYGDEPKPVDPIGMWECSTLGDVPLYTNRERDGCRKMELKPISTVPALADFPPRLQRTHPAGHDFDHPAQIEPALPSQSRSIPDWGKDWYARNSSDASVQSEICSLYSEWLQLVQRTRGGLLFGTDPSYGSDPSRRNYGPSNPFWDNARYVTLATIFGRGFVPIGCL